jgi:acyl-CoA thioester hydrolase
MTHHFTCRIYWEDTDAGGIVYYANYLKFAERARTEWLREKGFDQSQLAEKLGISFVVRRCEVDYFKPARLDDLLTLQSRLRAMGKARMTMVQSIYRQESLLAEVTVTLACIDENGKPTKIAAQVQQALE